MLPDASTDSTFLSCSARNGPVHPSSDVIHGAKIIADILDHPMQLY